MGQDAGGGTPGPARGTAARVARARAGQILRAVVSRLATRPRARGGPGGARPGARPGVPVVRAVVARKGTALPALRPAPGRRVAGGAGPPAPGPLLAAC